MKYFLIIIALCVPILVFGQDYLKKKAFHRMVKSLIGHTVAEVKTEEINAEQVVWLDARDLKEHEVSKIKDATFVGYEDFDLSRVSDVSKDANVVVYCSVGYRSEKIAEQLQAAGYTNVSNLVGGIFDWHNQGRPVVDTDNQSTNKVHGYSKTWGIWLTEAEVVYE